MAIDGIQAHNSVYCYCFLLWFSSWDCSKDTVDLAIDGIHISISSKILNLSFILITH